MKGRVILVLVFFLSACSSEPEPVDSQGKIADLEAQVQQLQEDISHLQSERDELQAKYDQATAENSQDPLSQDLSVVVIAARNFQAGEIVPMEGIITAPLPMEFVIETWIAGTEVDDLLFRVNGCRALYDIPRGMILTWNLIDCP